MHFEDLLGKIGDFGRYQKLLCFIVIPFTTGIVGLTFYTQIFILTAPFHTCNLQSRGDGVRENNWRNQSSRTSEVELMFFNKVSSLLNETDYNSGVRTSYICHQFDPNKTAMWVHENPWLSNASSLDQFPAPTEPCINGWDYDKDLMFSTYTSEQNFVCENAWRPYMIATAFWIGNTIGSWIFGFISDVYGRRPTIALCNLVYGAAGVISIFVSDYYGFLALRVMVGLAHHTLSHLPFVLVVEYCGLKSRTVPLLTIMMTYTIASILTPLLAWVIWDWRTLGLITSIPPLISLIFYKWIPESSSWLIARGKNKAAKKQLEIVAKVNGQDLPYDMLEELLSNTNVKESDVTELETTSKVKESGSQDSASNSEEKDLNLEVLGDKTETSARASNSIVRIIKYPHLRKNVLVVLLIWMLACMCYYGHCQNTANLSSNIFLSYLLGALVEIPSWSAPWLINRFGRRIPLIVAFLIAGIASLLYSVLPQDVTWLVLSMAMIGRASITGAYYITLQYGPEIFPTVVRGQGVALSETLGGVAIFLSPSIVYLGEFNKTAPLLVFGGLSVLAGLVTVLLPETCGVVLPQTISQAEQFSKKAGIGLPCCSKPQRDVKDV